MRRSTSIREARARWPLIAAIEWEDGTSSVIDLGVKLLVDPALTHIAFDEALFATLARSDAGTAIIWSDGSTMSSSTLDDGEKRDIPRS